MDVIKYMIDCFFDELLENNIFVYCNIFDGYDKICMHPINEKYDGYVCYNFYDVVVKRNRKLIPLSYGTSKNNDSMETFIQKITNIASNYNIKIMKIKDRLYMVFE